MPEEAKPAATDETDESKKTDAPTDTGDADHMHVKVYAPFKVYFDDIATSISAVNDTGPFDILPRHHNFMTLINTCEIVVRTDKGEEKFKITRGIMHVKADDVVVFLDV
jgi:F0F1-type ATP synthase epsilon subunit